MNRKGEATTQLLKKRQTSGFYVPSPDFSISATTSFCLKTEEVIKIRVKVFKRLGGV